MRFFIFEYPLMKKKIGTTSLRFEVRRERGLMPKYIYIILNNEISPKKSAYYHRAKCRPACKKVFHKFCG
jgi:hypothetical protein